MAKRTVMIEFDFNWVREVRNGDRDKSDDVYHHCSLPLAYLTIHEVFGGKCRWWGLPSGIGECNSVDQAKREAELAYLSRFGVSPDDAEPANGAFLTAQPRGLCDQYLWHKKVFRWPKEIMTRGHYRAFLWTLNQLKREDKTDG